MNINIICFYGDLINKNPSIFITYPPLFRLPFNMKVVSAEKVCHVVFGFEKSRSYINKLNSTSVSDILKLLNEFRKKSFFLVTATGLVRVYLDG